MSSASLRDRVAVLRREGRRRRLLVQLPPTLGGAVVAAIGLVLHTIMPRSDNFLNLAGLMCIHVGPWCAVLALRPQDRRAVRAFFTLGSLVTVLGVSFGLPSLFPDMVAAQAQARNNGIHLFVASQSLSLIGCAVALAIWVHAVLADICRFATARQTLARMWRGCGLVYLFNSACYFGYSIVALFFPSTDTFTRAEAALIVPLALIALGLGCLAFWEPLRTRVQEALTRIGEGVSAAAGIAELIGGLPPDQVVERARRSFRALPIDALTREHLLLKPVNLAPRRRSMVAHPQVRAVDVGLNHSSPRLESGESGSSLRSHARSAVVVPEVPQTSLASGAALLAADTADGGAAADQCAAELLAVSAPAQLGSVDAFISHSWYDDPDQKFAALQAWRARFVSAHGREPTVWFDRLCIDQSDVATQLPSVPIYLAGCRTLLALQGRTYFERLWCVLELHIFHQMGGSLDQIVLVPLKDDDAAGLAAGSLPGAIDSFDVQCARTTQSDDQARLLAVIEGSGEGIGAFNEWVRKTLLPSVIHFWPADASQT